ncbi:uncharacterized protein At1g65710-like [Nicotiana tabacum]|uniref:Serine/arginine repetitive matrix protein 2-like n=1 Tax=Nicotiana sylvestris TaxID=4096 RepID=A0A1U7YL69_NICSY|nr:PREDICTED: serine/arginine repetitive matrix protein 2-like [Nicotiana sylvestris]
MGSCLSKKSTSCSSSKSTSTTVVPNTNQEITKPNTQLENKKEVEGENVKKEIFVIKHRKSHEVDRKSEEEKASVKKANEAVESAKNGNNNDVAASKENGIVVSAPVRTSSCTKEEVDAILIQCGRLSRSSSTGKTGILGSSGSDNNGNPQRSRKYSGSKRSFDFENENGNEGLQENVVDCEDDGVRRHRQRSRQPRTPSSPSKGRRRTPSRERDQTQQQQQRSGSRERGSSSGGGGRRVSRSPGRRSESPITTTSNGGNVASGNANGNNGGRPGKMVSVPATVTSMVMDKSIDVGADNISAAAIKRIQVKRNADGSRTAASPRARSPARVNAKVLSERDNNQQQQPMSLSRSNSRKQEQSPYRRNPLNEIDTNVVLEQMPVPGLKAVNNNAPSQKLNAETISNGKVKEQQQNTGNVAMNVIVSGPESHNKPQRSRSLRLSRDLDINPETLSNPPQSYTSLLLEDIQNFHQKTNTTTTAFSLPPCVTKACSILDAVADLNSTTSSNLSSAFSDDRRRNPPASEQFNQNDNKKRLAIKDPFMESEVAVSDDLMEPSIQKYVTFRRGTDIEDQESSGSNSVVGGQPNWLSPSSWEPNSADSTDCWPTSKSYSRDDNKSPLGFQRHAVSEIGHDMEEGKRRVNVKKRDSSDNQQAGIGRGRVGPRGLHTISMAAST